MLNVCTPAIIPSEKNGMPQPAFVLKGGAPKPFYLDGNVEPTIDELMDDDVMRRVMARDGVQPDQLRSLLDCMRNRLRETPDIS